MYRLLQDLKNDEIIVHESVPFAMFMVLDARKVTLYDPVYYRNALHLILAPAYYLFDAGTKLHIIPLHFLSALSMLVSSAVKPVFERRWRGTPPYLSYRVRVRYERFESSNLLNSSSDHGGI